MFAISPCVVVNHLAPSHMPFFETFYNILLFKSHMKIILKVIDVKLQIVRVMPILLKMYDIRSL